MRGGHGVHPFAGGRPGSPVAGSNIWCARVALAIFSRIRAALGQVGDFRAEIGHTACNRTQSPLEYLGSFLKLLQQIGHLTWPAPCRTALTVNAVR